MSRLLRLVQDPFLLWRGRWLALAALGLVLAANQLSERHEGFSMDDNAGQRLLRWSTAPFAAGRQLLFDSYQRALPRVRRQQTVAVVEVDERSRRSVGQWPWPRSRLAELVDAIAAHGPAAIGLDLYMPEPDQTSPDRVALNLPAGHAELARELGALPNHEELLARALAAAPTVLGAGAFDFQTLSSDAGLLSAPLRTSGGDPLPYLPRYVHLLASLPRLQRAAKGVGTVSVDSQQAVIRRLPMAVAAGEVPVPSLTMEMLRVASGSDAIELRVGAHGIERVAVAELSVPTQAGGDVWLHFADRAGSPPRELSAADVLQGQVPGEALAGKLVLVGLTGLGLSDMRLTPLGESVPGIEIQAQMLESLLDGRMLLRPWWMKPAEQGLLAAAGLLMVWLVPLQARRRRSGGRFAESRRWGWWVLGFVLVVLAAGFALFRSFGWMVDAAAPAIGLALLAAALASSSMLEIERDNLRLARERERLREQAARVAGELEAARRIQLGSLPDAERAFPGEHRFEIAALMQPAREVGGDLYDFFLIDGRRLCFLVGDVAGKGLPASLFMAMAKTLTRSHAIRTAGGAERIVTAANADLARENGARLFVTLLLGVLDLDTGVLELVNAGHDAPWLVDAAGRVSQLATDRAAGGLPLCVRADARYRAQKLQLAPGSLLCLATDGVPEAMDSGGAFFGRPRLQAALARLPAGAEPVAQAVRRLRDEVSSFVGAAEPSDDLTLLMLRWLGPQTAVPPSAAAAHTGGQA